MRHSTLLREIVDRIISGSLPYPERVVALNLLYETRACAECEAAVEALIHTAGSDRDRLARALTSYLEKKVRSKPEVSFLGPGNDSNAATISGDHHLIHAWNVTTFLSHLEENDPIVGPFLDRTGLRLMRNDIREWLMKAEREMDRIKQILDFHNEYFKTHPGHPVWVAKWLPDAASWIDENEANSWLRCVGKAPSSVDPQHIMLLRYPAGRAMPLRRPTQFEAGWFALHFPSPLCVDVNRGGFAMLADEKASGNRLVSEFIHARIEWRESDFVNLKATVPVPAGNLRMLRIQHFKRLLAEFEEQLADWMVDPDDPFPPENKDEK